MKATTVLDDIPFSPDSAQLLEQMRAKEGSRVAGEVAEMARCASDLGRPRAVYRACLIESRGDDFVVLRGERFQSRVLAVNVEKVHRVFPFVATCGTELEEWSGSFTSGLKKFCAETIKGMALGAAIGELVRHMDRHHHPGEVSMMNPGSLEDWPLSEQEALFSVLEDPGESIGVRLLDNLLMSPGMSASGLWFPSGEAYENCMLCPMEDCPGRRAPYDEELYERKYRKGSR